MLSIRAIVLKRFSRSISTTLQSSTSTTSISTLSSIHSSLSTPTSSRSLFTLLSNNILHQQNRRCFISTTDSVNNENNDNNDDVSSTLPTEAESLSLSQSLSSEEEASPPLPTPPPPKPTVKTKKPTALQLERNRLLSEIENFRATPFYSDKHSNSTDQANTNIIPISNEDRAMDEERETNKPNAPLFSLVHQIIRGFKSNKWSLTPRELNSIMYKVSHTGSFEACAMLIAVMENKGIKPDSKTYAHYQYAYLRRKNYAAVISLFDEMKEKNIRPAKWSYAYTFESAGKLGLWPQIATHFNQLRQSPVPIDDVLYRAAIVAYCQCSKLALAMDLEKRRYAKFGMHSQVTFGQLLWSLRLFRTRVNGQNSVKLEEESLNLTLFLIDCLKVRGVGNRGVYGEIYSHHPEEIELEEEEEEVEEVDEVGSEAGGKKYDFYAEDDDEEDEEIEEFEESKDVDNVDVIDTFDIESLGEEIEVDADLDEADIEIGTEQALRPDPFRRVHKGVSILFKRAKLDPRESETIMRILFNRGMFTECLSYFITCVINFHGNAAPFGSLGCVSVSASKTLAKYAFDCCMEEGNLEKTVAILDWLGRVREWHKANPPTPRDGEFSAAFEEVAVEIREQETHPRFFFQTFNLAIEQKNLNAAQIVLSFVETSERIPLGVKTRLRKDLADLEAEMEEMEEEEEIGEEQGGEMEDREGRRS